MTRSPELHELFSEWLATRGIEAAEDPPRDLALHAAGCKRCLRSATAFDTLGAIDVGAAAPPPVRVAPTDQSWRLLGVARYAVAGVALMLLAGTVAIGSSWLGSVRPTASTALRSTAGEGVLAGVPSAVASPTASEKPSPSPSERESSSADPSQAPTEVAAAPTIIIPAPTYQPPPPPPSTPAPTVAPTTRPIPATATPVPTSSPTPTISPSPTPSPDTDGDGVPDDIDECPSDPAGATPDPDHPGCPLPTLP